MLIDTARQIYAGPIEWGVRDCCTCPADVWVAMGWGDPMAPLRGRYSSRVGAVRLIVDLGGWETMVAAMARQMGLRPGVGGAGEIGLVRGSECTGTGSALALCLGPRRWAVKTWQGYRTVPEAVQQWAN
jgi:hypothetical protein